MNNQNGRKTKELQGSYAGTWGTMASPPDHVKIFIDQQDEFDARNTQVKACQVDGMVRDNSDSDMEKKRGAGWRNDWIQSD